MPDYAEMYKTLFRAQTKAIEILQAAQQATEEMYISGAPDFMVYEGSAKTEPCEEEE